MAAAGLKLNHIARESPNVKRLAAFYEEVLGFERIETPNFGDFDVIWLRLSPNLSLHLIERDPQSRLPEGPHGSPPEGAVADPRGLPRGHHISFGVSNYDEFVQSLKARKEGLRTLRRRSRMGRPDRSSSLILTVRFCF
ncbi:hypothetical protein MA16_Dca004589 [Dendrobium catenatum]|uniref:VOC domain-containing protein n=1 Tax=Dendrobium catenatum TaxID=906689 RepID=A0A2I0VNI5_9ASPA|nr:hypothetical protein MA16_Dca004589 [Dendrobium catenatum]